MTAITILKQWFANFKKPTQEHFWAWIDSFWHKSEKIPMANIEGLESLVEGTASAEQLRNHLTDTHAHKEVLDKKVDKVAGKKLSTEDFTTELRRKLEALEQVDISGLLPKGGYTGTAQDLKKLIDNLTRILQSPDTELDELQEIVAYIKQNKHILSTLGISNIAGLTDTLAAKADKNHNHDERYAPLHHTHNEYAFRTHRHHWDDVDGKPAFNYLSLSGGVIKPSNQGNHNEGVRISKANNGWAVITLGTEGNEGLNEKEFALCRNNNGIFLIREGGEKGKTIDILILDKNGIYIPSEIKTPTMVINSGTKSEDVVKLRVANKTLVIGNESFNETYSYRGAGFKKDGSTDKHLLTGGGGHIEVAELEEKNFVEKQHSLYGRVLESREVLPIVIRELYLEGNNTKTNVWSNNNELNVGSRSYGGYARVRALGYNAEGKDDNYVLTAGGGTVLKSELEAAFTCGYIDKNWSITPPWYNRTIFVKANAVINLTELASLKNIAFRKVADNLNVSFVATGKKIIYTGDTQFNGRDGSTAVASCFENKIYIDIRNI